MSPDVLSEAGPATVLRNPIQWTQDDVALLQYLQDTPQHFAHTQAPSLTPPTNPPFSNAPNSISVGALSQTQRGGAYSDPPDLLAEFKGSYL